MGFNAGKNKTFSRVKVAIPEHRPGKTNHEFLRSSFHSKRALPAKKVRGTETYLERTGLSRSEEKHTKETYQGKMTRHQGRGFRAGSFSAAPVTPATTAPPANPPPPAPPDITPTQAAQEACTDLQRTGARFRFLDPRAADLNLRGSQSDLARQAAIQLSQRPHNITSDTLVIGARDPPRDFTVQEWETIPFDVYRMRDGRAHWVHTEYDIEAIPGNPPAAAQTQPLLVPTNSLPEFFLTPYPINGVRAIQA